MPELPEVETIARGLAKRVTGDEIESVWLGQKKEPLKSPASQIAATLEHSRIEAVRRMGKHIVFDLEREASPAKNKSRETEDEGEWVQAIWIDCTSRGGRGRPPHTEPNRKAQWIVHLGMTGRLQICEPRNRS